MNCRSFERQTADWLSRRLPAERSEEMTAHQETCPACARAAAAEVRLRGLWREAGPPPATDLWPHLSARIDVPAARTRWPSRALAGAVTIAVFSAVFCWAVLPGPTPHAGPPTPDRIAAAPSVRPAPAGDSWRVLRDGAHSDPLVDDPAGANMENLWTTLNTANK